MMKEPDFDEMKIASYIKRHFPDWSEDRIDEDFSQIVTYHQIAALFHGGHFEDAGMILGTMFDDVVEQYKPA